MLDALENDVDFKALKQKYETPNAFTIMGNKRREEWHSSFVSWLLDPKQNHRLGTFPLERFLKLVESKSENLKIDMNDIANMNFETEHPIKMKKKERIDIWGKSDSLILIIENKIKAKENKTEGIFQSDSYYSYFENKYKNKQKCYVLLKARSETHLSNEHFIEITYQELFDEVIRPTCEYSERLGLENTQRVLNQYILDISNPFTSITLAKTQKDISNRIYEKHKEIIEEMRTNIEKKDSDNESDFYKFYNKNKKYINNIILNCVGKIITDPREIQKLRGIKLSNKLLEMGYIIPNQTELIYRCMSATCIIMVDENRKFYTGYYIGDYDGSQDVDILESGCGTLREAQLVVEKAVGSLKENGGENVYKLRLLHSGKKEAEGKTIGDILNSL